MSTTVKPSLTPAFEEIVAQLPPLMTAEEFGEKFNVPEGTRNDWRSKGTGPKFVKLGGKAVYYRRDDILAWLKSRVFSTTAEAKAANN